MPSWKYDALLLGLVALLYFCRLVVTFVHARLDDDELRTS